MPKLWIVGTPLGNLGDFSPRAVDTLRKADFIAAEDTRVTVKLLNHFGIHTPIVSYHEHNRVGAGERILARIQSGETCALVTDAGMPAISDPGTDLVDACHRTGVPVETVPGASAFATAVAASGFPAGRFTFEGFLSVTKKQRREHFESLREETRTMVFYEAPHKLPNTLQDFAALFGDRPLCICRELTKLHEEIIRTTCTEAYERFGQGGLKGELVLIVQGKPPQEQEKPACTLEEALGTARRLRSAGLTASMAAKEAAKQTGLPKSEIYRLLAEEEAP
ncbi:MAG: 16S rRNA (cytidine(1402)-2'-O)-methyltransferase [Oscillospiraceae bacterium]|jgi:16S rRNA (cytidine1402-2'-O)-methyltransferase|nr:16S rRNA (cytidine(1402)-2'-O)-methyltransferase [Oscillospiraceae bacterium]